MIPEYGYLYELELDLFGIVVECFHDVGVKIDHAELVCHERNERSLREYGEKNYQERNVEDIVMYVRAVHGGHDGEYDGRRSSEARPGDQKLLFCRAPKWREQQKDGHGPRNESKKEGYAEGGKKYLRQLRGERQKPEQEEHQDLHESRHAVEEVDQVLFVYSDRKSVV